MANRAHDIGTARTAGCGAAIAALADADGTAAHAWPRRLRLPAATTRDLADAVHALCKLHGRHPGSIDRALAANETVAAAAWLSDAANGFAAERTVLAQLTAAAGPLPSTPGQAETDATIVAQAHALDMLAQSGRHGCAIGATAALLLDWQAVRAVLDTAALRFGTDSFASLMPMRAETLAVLDPVGDGIAVGRAVRFGAEQLLAQRRGLWSLLEARAEARGAL